MVIDLKKIWANHKGWVFTILLSVLSSVFYFTKDVITDYLERQEQISFNENLIQAAETDSVAQAFLENESFVRMFFSSPKVQEHIEELGIELHQSVVDQIISKDTTKISTRDYNAAGLNMHPDSVLPFQLSVLKFFKKLKDKGINITTSEDFEILKDVLEAQDIKTEPRRRRRANPAQF